jgi:hypothetical protein
LEAVETKNEAVSKFIIGLAQEDGNLDAAALHIRVVAAFDDPINGGDPDSGTRNAEPWESGAQP